MKLPIIYWSQSGNTETMAQEIAEGAKQAGAECLVSAVSDSLIEVVKEAQVLAFGCPSMGDEVLEESEMEPFIEKVEGLIAGKEIALFGSYGWGDGEWMRNWTLRMQDAGAVVVGGEGLICQEAPDAQACLGCQELGKKLASLLSPSGAYDKCEQ